METPSVSQVFLSHSTNDTGTVEKVLAFLEDHGFPCWIAPRDIAPGEDWPAAIASAVDQCPVFILFVSESSNRSGQVRIELERAVAAESKIIPLFIDECKPTGWMEYFISSRHWHSLDLTRLNDSLAELLPVICALGDQAFSRDITLLDSFLMDELNALEAGVSILEERPESSLVPGRMRSLCVISVGILGIAGRPGDEASSLIRSSVTRIVEQAIRGYGGVPEILDRDVTLGFFGLRETREDDIRRAVSCAIRIRRMMEKMNEKLRNTGFSAQFGTGVSSGMVRAGEGASGIPLKSEKTVQEAIDLASSEGLWVSEGTKSRCSRLFNWQRDERGWTVHESTSSLAGFRSGFNPAFQGRSAQISRLMNLFIEGCSKGENTCARIVGESGIGKTRFAELVAEKVSSASGAMIFRGSCHPFSETPLYTIRALVDSIAIPGNLLSQGHNAALLKRVRGETLSDEDCLPDDPELETALFLSALLSHDSGSSPAVLLLLDDAQWMDRESRKVLSRLFTFMDTGFPVLFLIVERTSPGNMSEMFPYAEDIHLEGLSHKEIEAIVLEMLETRSGEKNTRVFMDTMDHLARVSRGNPLSLISLIDHLLESDLISDETGKWRLTGKVGDLPEGDLRDILLWRLSQFDASVNGLLQVCAVTSGVFDADVIHSISARAGCVTVPPGMILHRLKDTGLVTSVSGGLRLSREAVREAILETIIPINRKLLFNAAAEHYESLFHDGDYSDPAFICSCYLEAEDFPRAFSWGAKAARNMLEDSQFESAIALSEDVFEKASTVVENIDPENWADFLLLRASLYRETGNWHEAGECYAEGLKHCILHDLSEHEIRTRVFMSQNLISLGKYEEAVRELRLIIVSHEQVLEKPLEVIALRNLGVALWRSGNLEGAEECFRKNLMYAESSGDGAAGGIALGNLALVQASAGEVGKALESTQRKLEAAVASGSLKEQSIAQSNLGALYAMLGQFGDAEKHFLAQLAIDEKLGRRQGILAALSNLANLKTRYKAAEDRLRVYRRAESLARRIGDRNSLMHILGNMAPILLDEGMREEAALAAGEALDLAVSAGNSSLAEKNRKTLNAASAPDMT